MSILASPDNMFRSKLKLGKKKNKQRETRSVMAGSSLAGDTGDIYATNGSAATSPNSTLTFPKPRPGYEKYNHEDLLPSASTSHTIEQGDRAPPPYQSDTGNCSWQAVDQAFREKMNRAKARRGGVEESKTPVRNQLQPWHKTYSCQWYPDDFFHTGSTQFDALIKRLCEVRGLKRCKGVNMTRSELFEVCCQAKEVFVSQDTLLSLDGPITIVGSIHGYYTQLLNIFDNHGLPPVTNYLFLGNLVDGGRFQDVETLVLLLALKVKFPETVFLLRGRHEHEPVNRSYGFRTECQRRFGVPVYLAFTDLFRYMPVAAVVEDEVFCVNSGLSPDFVSLEQLNRIQRPIDFRHSATLDLAWSEPDAVTTGFVPHPSGISYKFGEDAVKKFLDNNELSLIVRTELVPDGFEFFCHDKMISIFSVSYFKEEYDNMACLLKVEHNCQDGDYQTVVDVAVLDK